MTEPEKLSSPEALEITHYCLGTMDPKCDRCQRQRDWLDMQDLPNDMRLKFQANMTRVDTVCIDMGYPHYKPMSEKDARTNKG